MTPQPLAEADWAQLYDAILWLVLIHGSVVLFAGSILMARALLPSLRDTNDIPAKAGKLIPLFYASAVAGFIGIVFCTIMFFDSASVVTEIYDRTWV